MTYEQFLSQFCGCYADAEGNRPCDNGCLCDRCMSPEMVKAWEQVKGAA